MITRVEDPLLPECPTSPGEGHGPKPRRWGSRTIRANLLTVLIPSALQSTDDITTGPCDANVGHGWRTNVLHAAVVISTGAEIAEQSFAATQQDRHNRNVPFVDERSTKVLPDCGCATSYEDVTVTGRFDGCPVSFLDPTVDEMEGRFPPAFR